MKTETLIRYPGVYRRSDSGVYQFGLRAPVDLRVHFPSGWAMRRSLETSDLREANSKAKALQAEWGQRFEAIRAGVPATTSEPGNLLALRQALLARVEAALPAIDARAASLIGEERQKLIASDQYLLAEGQAALQDGRVPDWARDWVDAVSAVRSPVSAAEALAAYVLLIELRIEALTDTTRTFPLRVERLRARRGLVESAPPVAISPDQERSTRSGRRISDALQAWAETPRLPKTYGVFERHATVFADSMGDPPLDTVDRSEAAQFKTKLQKWAIAQHKTASTADNVLVSVRALFNVARDQGWIAVNPFERLRIEVGGKQSEGREPWTRAELAVLFNDPIWTEYRLPAERKAGAEAAYWIPLLACYTGARVSELAQLWTDDLQFGEAGDIIEFRANAERGQQLKTVNSWRSVPIHSELLRLGLQDYVETLPSGPMFPSLPRMGVNGPGGQFGQWFGQFKRTKGFASAKKTLHSFRHLVASELRLAGATDAQADAITGHAGQGLGRTVYSATIRREAARLRPVIELLAFPELQTLRSSRADSIAPL